MKQESIKKIFNCISVVDFFGLYVHVLLFVTCTQGHPTLESLTDTVTMHAVQ